MISLCKVQLGLKQNTFTQLTISDHSLDFVVTVKCDLISKFATWLNFEFSIFSDLKYIKYSSRNWFIISNQSSFTFIISSFFGFWVVQNGSEVQKSPGQAGIDSVLTPYKPDSLGKKNISQRKALTPYSANSENKDSFWFIRW